MKKILALALASSVILVGCSKTVIQQDSQESSTVSMNSEDAVVESEIEANSITVDLRGVNPDSEESNVIFPTINDEELLNYVEDTVYFDVVEQMPEGVFVENVEAVYISQEYIDELTYNSKMNVFFGYTLAELDEQFQGTKYMFTVDDDGKTAVRAMTPYDDTYDKIIQNVAIGTGVILVCVTISVVSYGAGAPAACAIFAMSAKTGAIMALSSSLIGGTTAGLLTGVQTGDWDQAKKDALLAGSEGFKCGAICGAIAGGVGETVGLYGATMNGLTMDEAAQIQMESKLPLSLIKKFQSYDQYEIVKDAGLYGGKINGSAAIIRDIDLNQIDPKSGLTNLQLMQKGNAPLDPTGVPYELHHMAQENNGVLAILTKDEHVLNGNKSVWHLFSESEIDRAAFDSIREAFWKDYAKQAAANLLAA